MQKIGTAVIQSENIRVAHSFRRNATMLTRYNVYLVESAVHTCLNKLVEKWRNLRMATLVKTW